MRDYPNTARTASAVLAMTVSTSSAEMESGGAKAMPSLLARTIRPRSRVAACSLPPMFRAGSNLVLLPRSRSSHSIACGCP